MYTKPPAFLPTRRSPLPMSVGRSLLKIHSVVVNSIVCRALFYATVVQLGYVILINYAPNGL